MLHSCQLYPECRVNRNQVILHTLFTDVDVAPAFDITLYPNEAS